MGMRTTMKVHTRWMPVVWHELWTKQIHIGSPSLANQLMDDVIKLTQSLCNGESDIFLCSASWHLPVWEESQNRWEEHIRRKGVGPPRSLLLGAWLGMQSWDLSVVSMTSRYSQEGPWILRVAQTPWGPLRSSEVATPVLRFQGWYPELSLVSPVSCSCWFPRLPAYALNQPISFQ